MTASDPATVTIAVPAYQAEGFLARALDSVLAQSDPDWTLVVVDDGSTDGTLALARAYAARDPARIHVLTQANAGPGAARNRAMAAATGEYVLFLDADDALMPEALAILRADLRARGPADLLFGGHAAIRLDGRRKVHRPDAAWGTQQADFRRYLRGQGVGPTHGAVLMRRALALRLGYPESIRNNEDVVLFAQMLALGRTRALPDVLAVKYRRASSLRHDVEALRVASTRVPALLFDPARLPPALLAERPAFEADRQLACFRAFSRAGRGRQARAHFRAALRLAPSMALRPGVLFRYLRSWARGWRA